MFAVVVSRDGAPLDIHPDVRRDHIVEIVGDRRHVAIMASRPDALPAEAGYCGIQTLDRRFWLVGRFLLDARDELRARLADHLPRGGHDLSDAELCLRAYAAWGDGFVDRLTGDFCFALWDAARNRLVCARDQLGVRCLFHAEAGGSVLVSDSLDWLAAQGVLPQDFDDLWIADFLGVGHSLDVERTVYRHIRRLPPAHRLVVAEGRSAVDRYWRLDIREPLYLRDRRLYAEQFLDLLSRSIRDRLPSGRVGISMSGGLDSTTLAACAVQATGDPSRVVAETVCFERSVAADEGHFSTLAARHLGIELKLRVSDDLVYDPEWRSRSGHMAEPNTAVVSAHVFRGIARERAGVAPVWFHGEGPDNALDFERNAYLGWLLGRKDWLRLGEAVLHYVRAKGLGGWRQTLARYAGLNERHDDSFAVPPWLERSLAGRLGLERRFRRVGTIAPPGHPDRHPWHPRAVASFGDPLSPSLFGDYEYEESLGPTVLRHPFLDLRVLEYMLSVPPVPWARRKLLMREAMRGRLPAELLARDKVSLPVSPVEVALRTQHLPGLSGGSDLAAYVDVRALPVGPPTGEVLERVLAVHALDHWLATRSGQAGPSVVPMRGW